MPNNTDEVRRDPRRSTGWRCGIVLGAAVTAVAIAAGAVASPSSAAIVPPPSTTLAPRPTTTPPPRPTTTPLAPTTTRPAATTPPSTDTTPAPTAPPPVTAATTTTTTTAAQPIPDPPTNPPTSAAQTSSPETSEPQTAPFVVFAPVTVDPEDPAVQPPVIVDVTTGCINGFAFAKVLVQNVDLYHYPEPFEAFYDWTLTDGTTALESGSFQLLAWDTRVVHLDTTGPGTYTFAITDADLGSSAGAEVVLPDCASQPAPSPDPLGPLVIVPSVTCSEDLDPDNGSGVITFAVHNQPGDDSTAREYDFAVTWTQEQVKVAFGFHGSIGDTHWMARDIEYVHSGTYLVTVTDQADPALVANVSVEVPACAPDMPPAEPVAPLGAPQILQVSPHCADPVLLDGWASFTLFNPNYQFLGGAGDLTYDWTLESESAVIESFNGYFNVSGTDSTISPQLAPGTYTATITATGFPDMTDSATFTIADCTVDPEPAPEPLVVYGVTNVCIPGDDTGAVFFVVDHLLHPNIVGWAFLDGQDVLASNPEVHLQGAGNHVLSARHVPAGSYQLVVTSSTDPSVVVSTPVEIGMCGGPADPADPIDPVDPVDPTTTTTPGDPTTTVPGDPTTTTTPTEGVDSGGGTDPTVPEGTTGTLPATGAGSATIAGVAGLIAAAGLLLVLVSRVSRASSRRATEDPAG